MKMKDFLQICCLIESLKWTGRIRRSVLKLQTCDFEQKRPAIIFKNETQVAFHWADSQCQVTDLPPEHDHVLTARKRKMSPLPRSLCQHVCVTVQKIPANAVGKAGSRLSTFSVDLSGGKKKRIKSCVVKIKYFFLIL